MEGQEDLKALRFLHQSTPTSVHIPMDGGEWREGRRAHRHLEARARARAIETVRAVETERWALRIALREPSERTRARTPARTLSLLGSDESLLRSELCSAGLATPG